MINRRRRENNPIPCRILVKLFICALFIAVVPGCDRVTRHKVLSTLFDGVPSLPPVEELCREKKSEHPAQSADAANEIEVLTAESGSDHPPFTEKRCDDCHDFGASNRLIKPKKDLCFVCHDDFIQGSHIHGPVSVGDCLACHLPHNSRNSSLLVASRADICTTCHRENRLAERMHAKVTQRDLLCVDCHDPHFGEDHYFLN